MSIRLPMQKMQKLWFWGCEYRYKKSLLKKGLDQSKKVVYVMPMYIEVTDFFKENLLTGS